MNHCTVPLNYCTKSLKLLVDAEHFYGLKFKRLRSVVNPGRKKNWAEKL